MAILFDWQICTYMYGVKTYINIKFTVAWDLIEKYISKRSNIEK